MPKNAITKKIQNKYKFEIQKMVKNAITKQYTKNSSNSKYKKLGRNSEITEHTQKTKTKSKYKKCAQNEITNKQTNEKHTQIRIRNTKNMTQHDITKTYKTHTNSKYKNRAHNEIMKTYKTNTNSQYKTIGRKMKLRKHTKHTNSKDKNRAKHEITKQIRTKTVRTKYEKHQHI